MISTLNFKDASVEKPEYYRPILLQYKKGKQRVFITQGILIDDGERLSRTGGMSREQWYSLGRGETYYDYAGRQIENLLAKASKNKVIGWLYMDGITIKTV